MESSDRVRDEIAMLSEVCPSEMGVFTSYASSSNRPFDTYCDPIADRTHPTRS
jgi:hypothetical protein